MIFDFEAVYEKRIKPVQTVALIKLMRENRWTIVLSGFLLVIGTMNVLLIRQNLKLRALLDSITPTTVVVSNEGVVQNAWNGLVDSVNL